MKTLRDILYKVRLKSVNGNLDVTVTDIQLDSRRVTKGSCFIAIKGNEADGHNYISAAVNAGAIAIICGKIPARGHENVTYVEVADTENAAGLISNQFYDEPSTKLKLVGVTGTNGKTTIATLLFKLFTSLGFKTGLISTVENRIGEEVFSATHTTPDAVSLNSFLEKMLLAGCTHVFMECSSHAVHQQRLAGLEFAGAIFSNISHDHLDYHKTFDEYIRVKKSWFDSLPQQSFAISNADDKRGEVMLQNFKGKKYLYSLKTMASIKGKIIENSLVGLHMLINDHEVHFRMIGAFNAYNLLAVYGAAVCLGQQADDVLRNLSNLSGAQGRFDYMFSAREKLVGIIDYAHTPDALLNVLATIRNLRQGKEKIITVVGCGGNRDSTKRPVMAEVACQHSDKVIFTSDNPRNEDPQEILRQMEAGVNVAAKRKYITIADRREAIKTAVSLGDREDIILVAGKGHEKYQEISGVRHEFDDKKVLQEMFDLLEK